MALCTHRKRLSGVGEGPGKWEGLSEQLGDGCRGCVPSQCEKAVLVLVEECLRRDSGVGGGGRGRER